MFTIWNFVSKTNDLPQNNYSDFVSIDYTRTIELDIEYRKTQKRPEGTYPLAVGCDASTSGLVAFYKSHPFDI